MSFKLKFKYKDDSNNGITIKYRINTEKTNKLIENVPSEQSKRLLNNYYTEYFLKNQMYVADFEAMMNDNFMPQIIEKFNKIFKYDENYLIKILNFLPIYFSNIKYVFIDESSSLGEYPRLDKIMLLEKIHNLINYNVFKKTILEYDNRITEQDIEIPKLCYNNIMTIIIRDLTLEIFGYDEWVKIWEHDESDSQNGMNRFILSLFRKANDFYQMEDVLKNLIKKYLT